MNHDFQEQDAIRYFLGTLSEGDQLAFEEKYFTDEEFSGWLEEVETDLIDDYVRGELSATESLRFEEKYLVSERRQSRLKAAAAIWENERSLTPIVAEKDSGISFLEKIKGLMSFPQFAFGAPVVLVLVLLVIFSLYFRQPAPEIAEKDNKNINVQPTPSLFTSDTPEISPTPDVSPTTIKKPTETPTPQVKPSFSPSTRENIKQIEPPQPAIASISLFPSSRSEGEIKKVVLKKMTKSLYLRLNRDIEGDFENYQAEVSDSHGNLILNQKLSGKKALGIIIPTKNLSNDNYKITLKGLKGENDFKIIGSYYFMIEKK